ncbi:DUF4365 domain-containing protein [Kribbella sp. NBC_01245]|uniref:DUF4365 domain-containing protein n=1 Tax=Kribbella sp. NBC_01245 TaxID=2903578 RepID=UPI002E2C8C4C|nr:DUF4365 domain-containing protein [Kribbella sp. NBC_01245]
MEVLQVAYLHAVAAAAGCTLGSVAPDRGIADWTVGHISEEHTADTESTIKVQLKSTHQVAPSPSGDFWSITLENEHIAKLAQQPVTLPRILVAMILPREIDDWVGVSSDFMTLRHCAYWANLAGTTPSGQGRSNVRIPTANVFDVAGLCSIMATVGRGEVPR